MTDKRDRPINSRDMSEYQNKMMGDYETRGVTTAHLQRPAQPKPKPLENPVSTLQPAQAPKASPEKP